MGIFASLEVILACYFKGYGILGTPNTSLASLEANYADRS